MAHEVADENFEWDWKVLNHDEHSEEMSDAEKLDHLEWSCSDTCTENLEVEGLVEGYVEGHADTGNAILDLVNRLRTGDMH